MDDANHVDRGVDIERVASEGRPGMPPYEIVVPGGEKSGGEIHGDPCKSMILLDI
jgi:hypothetical protein